MDGKIPITKSGLERIKQELHNLTSVQRPQVQRAIAEAREHGDLKENAEYHAAKEQQGFIEGRIQELNGKMAMFHVVDPARQDSGRVSFGATVNMQNVETEEEMFYQIVGPDEADLSQNRISYLSPVAKALIGKEEGDVVEVAAPKGKIEVEITRIRYA